MRSVKSFIVPACVFLAAALAASGCATTAAPAQVRDLAAATHGAFKIYRAAAESGPGGPAETNREEFVKLGESIEACLAEIEAWATEGAADAGRAEETSAEAGIDRQERNLESAVDGGKGAADVGRAEGD